MDRSPDTAAAARGSAARAGAWIVALALLAGPACGGGPEAPAEEGSTGGDSPAARQASKAKGKRPGAFAGRFGDSRAAEPAVPVIVEAVGTGDMQAFLDTSATFEAEAEVEVVSQATGVVVDLAVEEGDVVRKGDVLARLAYEDLELAEERARSELERLQNEFARAEKLSAESFISDEDYQQIRFDLRRAEIDWKSARLELDRTRIAAPIAGTVTSRMINVGQLVRENEAVYELVDFESLIAPVYVPEKYLAELHVGQEARVAPRGFGQPVRGRVKRIAPVVDSESGTVRVVVDLPPGRDLRPGMFADVQIVLDAHEGVVVLPKKSLVYEDERPHVFVVSGGVAERREVELGYQDAGRAEVVVGVDAGELIVLVGQSTLKSGSPVAAEDEDGNPVDVGSSVDAASPGEIAGS